MPCRVLALLLSCPNRVISVDTISRELWGDSPPRSATTTIQTYIHHIRKQFGNGDPGLAAREVLVTLKPGYLLRLDQESLDSECFRKLFQRAHENFERGAYDLAEENLRGALGLWRGSALSNISAGPVLSSHIVQLEENRLAALELRIEADMKLGRYRQVVGELRSLVETFPVNERLRAQLITALHHCGRRAEALSEYTKTWRMLAEEFGLEPTHELRSIQRDILSPRAS